jgi:hypothetical protein
MTLSRTIPIVVAAVSIALTLTACDPSAPAPTPSATVPVESATPTPTPVAEQPELNSLIVSTEGLGDGGPGDLFVGQAPVSNGDATDLVTFSADECAAEFPDDPGLWVSTYDDIDNGDGLQAPFAIFVKDETIQYLSVNTPEITTVDGLGMGSSLDAILGTYSGGPDAVVDHADISQVYVINGTNGKLLFEVAIDGIKGYWPADQLNTVIGLYVIPIDAEVYGLAGGDAAFGVCNNS